MAGKLPNSRLRSVHKGRTPPRNQVHITDEDEEHGHGYGHILAKAEPLSSLPPLNLFYYVNKKYFHYALCYLNAFSAVITRKIMMGFLCVLEEAYRVIDYIHSVLQDLKEALEFLNYVLENFLLEK